MEKPVIRDEWVEHAEKIGYDFALVFEHDNFEQPYDYCGNWETAQTIANEGYVVVVINEDTCSSRTVEEWQKFIDNEYAAAIDCFGEGHKK